jgi:hypothetical protein
MRQYSDAAKRMSDIVNGLIVAQPWDVRIRSWIAVKLADGDTDGVLYDSQQDARDHQADEFTAAYLPLRTAGGGMQPRECEAYLAFHRMAYDNGYRLPDPDRRIPHNQVPQLVMPLAREDLHSQLQRLITRSGHSTARYRKG